MSKTAIDWSRERRSYGRRVLTSAPAPEPANGDEQPTPMIGCYACGGYDGHTAIPQRVERTRPPATPGGRSVTVLECGHPAL